MRGVVRLLDTSIDEVLVIARDGTRHTAAVDTRDIGESLSRIVNGGDDAMWIECEVARGIVTQFFLVADGTRVDAKLASPEGWEIEEDVVHLCKLVWRDARVPLSWEGDTQDVNDADDERPEHANVAVTDVRDCGCWREAVPLMAHQTTTVAWMRRMEAEFPMTFTYHGNLRVTTNWFVDTENECFTRSGSCREAELVGGVCADGMGRGKTASVLRLISETLASEREQASGHVYDSRATLVILPLNLVGQWKQEMRKFLHFDSMRVHFVVQGKDLPTMQEALTADIVVTTFHFLRHNRTYADMVDRCLRDRPRERCSLSAWARVPGHVECVLEAVEWRRVVVDEIHQSFERIGDAKHLRLFRSRALWGLSATPCLNNDQAQQLYTFLAREKAHHPNLLAALVERCVRVGVPSKADTREMRSVRRVSLSAEERVLLEDTGSDSLAETVRKITFVDMGSGGDEGGDGVISQLSLQRSRERDALRAKVQGHERGIRVLEKVGEGLEEDMRRLDVRQASDEERRTARLAYEAHQEDLVVAKGIHRRELLRLRQRESVDDAVHQRKQRIQEEAVCAECGARGGNLHMLSVCLHLLCSTCLGKESACGVCGEVILDAFPVETTRGVGTKMREIASLIESLLAPCILFVQWKSMVRGTRSFLRSVGVRVHTLDGNLSQRQSALHALHDEGAGVLLLCLEEGFAGLHLPHVSHIIFAHAIVGDRDRVMTLESQAVARCLRYGQTRDVKTYSFVVSNTEECVLYDRTHDVVSCGGE